MINFTEKDGAIFFEVKVAPRSSKSEIVGELDGTLKIKLKSQPIDGAANAELIKLLSKIFEVSKSRIEIAGGQNSKSKRIKISDISAENFISKIQW